MRVPGVSLESVANQACWPSGVLRLGKLCNNRARAWGLSEQSAESGAYFREADGAAGWREGAGDSTGA
jgi:hypothetical protein